MKVTRNLERSNHNDGIHDSYGKKSMKLVKHGDWTVSRVHPVQRNGNRMHRQKKKCSSAAGNFLTGHSVSRYSNAEERQEELQEISVTTKGVLTEYKTHTHTKDKKNAKSG